MRGRCLSQYEEKTARRRRARSLARNAHQSNSVIPSANIVILSVAKDYSGQLHSPVRRVNSPARRPGRLTTGVVSTYYAINGHVVAMRKGTNGPVYYLLADQLGSTSAVVDPATDAVIASRKYWPYGGERAISGDARLTSHWFTGQRDEDFDGLGLYNYNARFYSTLAGRFLSVDR